MTWIKYSDKLPYLNKNVLVYAKEGFYWPDIHHKDERPLNMYVGYFHDSNIYFKNLKPKIDFKIDCGCSGPEFDEEKLEILYWMPLPEPPEKI